MNRSFSMALGALLSLSAIFAQDYSISMRSAVEFSIPTRADFAYQVQEGDNLSAWQPVGSQIFGDGSTVTLRLPTPKPAHFFRTEAFAIKSLNAKLEEIRARRGVPALACAVVLNDRIVGIGAVGLRKNGVAGAPVTAADKWHIGSLTKSMTATLAAMLVEEGRARWEMTLEEVFPEVAPRMHAGWRKATLEQLTSNRGGAPTTIPATTFNELGNFSGIPHDARRLLLERLTAAAPASMPGTRYEYSNFGFAIAGHMLETVMQSSWEELINARVFGPLEMRATGFGAPAASRYLDQPLGHSLPNLTKAPALDNPISAVEAGLSADNPPAIGPAGTVHSSVIDLANYAIFHLRAHRKDGAILSQASARKLHTAYPNNSNYAHGWSVVPRTWANGSALNHTGTNLQWYSNIWLAPERGFAVVILCNLGGDSAFAATDEVAALAVQDFLK